MRPIAVTPRETFDYVLEDNRQDPVEEQAVFTLRSPTLAEDAEYLDMAQRGSVGSRSLAIVRSHLKGWSGVVDEDGAEVEFAETASGRKGQMLATEESIKALGPKVMMELARAVIESSYPTQEQVEK